MPSYSQSDRLSPNQWVVAASVFGAMVLASLALGFSAGRAPSPGKPPATPVVEKPKAKPPAGVEKTDDPAPPPKKTEPKPVVIKRPEPAKKPEPEPEPEMKKPEPEPEPKPEVKKPDPKHEAKKIEPKKTEVAKKEPPKKGPAKDGEITYDSHVKKIIQQKCIGCHGEGSIKGKLDMKTLALMMKGGNGGPAFVPGKPEDSPIWTSIENGEMPPSDKPQLTDDEKKSIHDWIMAGAKEK